ncbi:MAG TPA: glutathione S-transferase [Noviherbaspirillum sp.]|uniref:glutathione S-transferase family protein n=1 Tax=Noviherbaspirillum sp. TaxID=1926288 RepID=UPI002D2F5BFD|nr:glutathione S-transferase [Noviherbaspirillum sp.]HYD97012.1 glutathione S-transferase [Noviherbaspirillum sp.]
MQAAAPIDLYRSVLSGHAHRVELFLSLLGLRYTAIDVDLRAGEQKKPEFLRRNPFGQVPVIDDNGTVVADSNAILVYLALRYGDAHWLPRDAAGAAAVQRWLSVAAGDIAFGPALARLGMRFGRPVDMEAATQRAARLFTVMEQELQSRAWLAGEHITIADVAGYSYIARAPEGGIALDPYPALRAWLARIEALPRFVPMIELPAPPAQAA